MKKLKKITSINITNNYILINLSDNSKYKISDDAYFEYKFKANDEIDDNKEKLIKQLSNFHMAYLNCLNKIKYKDRSEYEMRSHMYDEFKLLKPEVDEIIEKLKRYDFINDDRYTTDLISNNEYKLYGYNKIKNNLVNASINSERIEKFLIYDYDQQINLANEFAAKTVKTIRNKTKVQVENSLRQKLLYRGFKNDVVSNVVSTLDIQVDAEIEDRLLQKDFDKIYTRLSKRYEDYDLSVRIINYLRGRGYSYSKIKNKLEEMENGNE